MNILALDTTGRTCGAAVMSDGLIRSEITMNNALTHSETLMPMVENVLDYSGLSVAQLDVISVAVGPGSFTGVRIGVCAAKALSQASGKPIACVDTLDALAQNVSFFDGVICPILDARRGQVYAAAYYGDKKIMDDCADDLSKVVHSLPASPVMFLGDGVLAMKEQLFSLRGNISIAPANCLLQRPSSVAIVGESMALAGALCTYNDAHPHYLRESQAQRLLRERRAK